jgi:hypothetical protein
MNFNPMLKKIHGKKTYTICVVACASFAVIHFALNLGTLWDLILTEAGFLALMSIRHTLSDMKQALIDHGVKSMTHEIKVEHKHDRSASRFL